MSVKSCKAGVRLTTLTLFVAILAACGPQKHENANQENLARGGKHGMRAACSEDIQKFCANADKKRRCLRDNLDKLSDTCKAAMAQRRNGNGGNGDADGQH